MREGGVSTAVVALYEEGRRAWPGVKVEPEDFARYVEQRAPAATGGPEPHADELYLACACAQGDSRALAEFDKHYLSQVPSYLARTDASARFVDDVRQKVRERLFVENKIAAYSGRGRLASWLRVLTLRVASNLRREGVPHVELVEDVAGHAIDPELGAIQQRFGEAFQHALRDALARMTAEERSLLRLHYLDGLNLDKIGIAFNVSRATVGRRLMAVRERIVEETRRLLRDRLHATSDELESLLRVVRSGFAVSISTILRGSAAIGAKHGGAR